MPLENPDQLHLRAAHGYMKLGLFEEANAELEEIDSLSRHLPEVLDALCLSFFNCLPAVG